MPRATGDDAGALARRVGDQLLDLRDGVLVDQRTLLDVRFQPGPDLERIGRDDQLFEKLRVGTGLDEKAIGAYAGLPGVAVFRGDRALDGAIDVGIVEDDERRVAAELHRDLLDAIGGLAQQYLRSE